MAGRRRHAAAAARIAPVGEHRAEAEDPIGLAEDTNVGAADDGYRIVQRARKKLLLENALEVGRVDAGDDALTCEQVSRGSRKARGAALVALHTIDPNCDFGVVVLIAGGLESDLHLFFRIGLQLPR
eukprot:CAMPEP_0204202646 /NCGR_PEP_ID=MMETSP0361-20130328/68380_1 /ASSEMBLY_ACC=CAM_ASM_000343 /TAXON_ID=268821 /ORGANISM="Scrippsiella Hangoei, Strain SHTV-5" /LENGTH=126 /DNA_ID=CAMNT_0051165497 /DNA_START=12 /DNA_END=388 /DNA_ORIENTATION=+